MIIKKIRKNISTLKRNLLNADEILRIPYNQLLINTRGMLGAEIDFIILELDNIANVAIGSRTDAMELRAKIEIPKLKQNDVIRVPARFNNFPHFKDKVLIKITEIKENKKFVYGYLKRQRLMNSKS